MKYGYLVSPVEMGQALGVLKFIRDDMATDNAMLKDLVTELYDKFNALEIKVLQESVNEVK